MTTPIVINNVSDLQAIQNNPSGSYVLGANIDASTFGYVVGGGYFASIANFTGVLDGQGYSIDNLQVALFSKIDTQGVVENLNLTNVHLYDSALAIENDGTIQACSVTGAILGHNITGDAAGLVIYNSSTGVISNSYSTASVAGNFNSGSIGGLVDGNDGLITGSYATGAVSGAHDGGGLVGTNGGTGIISNSYSTGSVTGNIVGGLVGKNFGNVTDSYATGSMVGTDGRFLPGGLVGYSTQGNVTSSYWDIETTGALYSAGGTGLTTAQLESGILPDGFDPTIWLDIAGQFPELRWQVSTDQPPTIDLVHSVVTGTTNERPGVTGSVALDIASGAIAFTDTDIADRPTASVVHQTASYQDALGHAFQLTDDQVFKFENAFLPVPSQATLTTARSIGATRSQTASSIFSASARRSESRRLSRSTTVMAGRSTKM